jgi:S1-C subfamily serine protease
VTNRHVVAGVDDLELNYWDGTSARAQLDALAVADDLALVKVSLRLPAVARLTAADPDAGAAVLVVGYPSGGEQAVERGEVVEYARLREPEDASPVMRMTADIVPGNSGGAVVDRRGELVGIVFGVETETGYGLAIPASAVRALLNEGGTARVQGCE